MHHAGLHGGLRPGRLDRLRQPGQAVAAHDQDVLHTPVRQLRANPGPELRALRGLHPDPENVLHTVHVDTDRDVRTLVPDLMPITDFHHDRVQIHDRVELLQRPGLPRLDLVQDRVGDLADRVVGQLRAQRPGQVRLDVADRHPARVEADDLLVQPAEPALALRDQPRVERRGPVPRHVQRHRPDLGGQGLRGRPVPRVRRSPTRRVALLVPQMPGQLRGQPPLEHSLDHLRQEPAGTRQLHAALLGGVDQIVEPGVVGHQLPQLLARHPARTHRLIVVLRHRHLPVGCDHDPLLLEAPTSGSDRTSYTDHQTRPRRGQPNRPFRWVPPAHSLCWPAPA